MLRYVGDSVDVLSTKSFRLIAAPEIAGLSFPARAQKHQTVARDFGATDPGGDQHAHRARYVTRWPPPAPESQVTRATQHHSSPGRVVPRPIHDLWIVRMASVRPPAARFLLSPDAPGPGREVDPERGLDIDETRATPRATRPSGRAFLPAAAAEAGAVRRWLPRRQCGSVSTLPDTGCLGHRSRTQRRVAWSPADLVTGPEGHQERGVRPAAGAAPHDVQGQ